MNTTAEQAWSRPPDAMPHLETDLGDLDNLFEFGDIGLASAADATQFADQLHHHVTHPHTPFEDINEAQPMSASNAHEFAHHDQFTMSQHMGHQQTYAATITPTSHAYTSEPTYQAAMQHSYHSSQPFQFQGQPNFPPNQHVPPTPNSFEMHGEAGRFLQSQLDPPQRFQMRKEDTINRQSAQGSKLPLNPGQIAFTPMASPAGTPQYNVQPEFTIPGAYFSPLTSPMLHAQNGQAAQQQQPQGYYTNPSTAPISSATSPLDPNFDIDMLGDDMSLPESANPQARRSNRRKALASRSGGPLARVKQSPLQKAVKRKSGTMLSSMVPSREMDATSNPQQPGSAGLQMPAQLRNSSSENGSISPEPLSEALMRPPPRPTSSLTHSPALVGQPADNNANVGKAATPKSLLSMRGVDQNGSGTPNDQKSAPTPDGLGGFEDLELPAAAAAAADDTMSRPSLPPINTEIQSGSTEDTPRVSARKTPKLGPLSTPSAARPGSALQSPSVAGSPMTASTPGALLRDKKPGSKGGRTDKKRGSMSASGSGLVSPALRPRISPSIKPLLPEGAVNSPTHALLLASKSNYQNLLEGNHLPGVNYPDSLSTGLTSKRTSHKVAEQGRRNRINEALKEMQSLLPRSKSGKMAKESSNSEGSPEAVDEEGKDSKEDSAAKSNSSKAATVESANEYIRKLQKENATLLEAKKELDEMKRRLGENVAATNSTEICGSATPDKA